ncbi:MAG: 1-acyl-sn-glycerol-3-phosphate acyltransferase [Clostridia bacterium]|nr:1-acyl-sn-glycerol-3-phosphate acyltransferase [Clostridia bacterium]
MLILYLVLSFGAVLAFARTPLQCPLYFLGTFLGLLLLHALVLAAASLFVNKKDPNPKRFAFYRKLLVTSIGPLLQLGAVQVKLVGEEKLPEGGFLLVGNHRSDFDPITAMYALRGRGVTFVTKKENLDIPVGGRLIAGAGCISLDRADDRQGLVVIRQVVRRIQAGEAIGIYPEGTRSKTGELLPFRVGCFKAAQWAKCPLVVLRTWGTENIGKNFFLRRTPVTLTVAAVFPYEQIRDLDTTEIGELVRSILTDGKEGESKWSA